MDAREKKRARRAHRRKIEVVISIAEIIVVVCAVVSLLSFVIWHFSYTDVVMADSVTLVAKGYDHFGEAEVLINGEPKYADFWKGVTATVNPSEGLSNGDEVTITFTFDEEAAKEAKLRVDGTESKVTVDGLMESTVITDELVFSGLQVETSGISPKVKLETFNTSQDPFVSQLIYSPVEERNFYADGDVAVIGVEIPAEALASHEYVTDRPTEEYLYEYNVESADSYVMSVDRISAENVKTMERIGTDLIYEADANEYGLRIFQQEAHIQPVFKGHKTTFRWVNPYVISAYFHSVTPEGIEIVENHVNDVQMVFGATITQDDGKSCLAEVVVQFTNIIEHEDGSVEITEDMAKIVSATYRDRNIKKLLSIDSNENYDTVKILE